VSLPRTISLAAGSTIHASGNLVYIEAAAGPVDITFGPDGAVARAQAVGSSIEVSDGYTSITASVACTLLVGHGRKFLPDQGSGGGSSQVNQAFNSNAGVTGNVNNIATVGGVVNAGTTTNVNGFGPPVPVEMLKNNGDGTWTNYPLQTADGFQLEVQPTHNSVAGFVANPGYSQPTVGLSTIRISIATAGSVAGLAVTDQFGDPVTVYPGDGSACIPSGVIPPNTGGRFYIPCAGTTAILFSSADGGWGFRVGMSQLPFTPRLG
jgi:hypothetical protein